MARFPKPRFADLLANYRTESSSVHPCSVIDPTVGGVNTCACRMSEALVLANRLAVDRAAIGKLGTGRGDGLGFLLGKYGYGTTANSGKLCPHGIGRGAQDLGAFLKFHWGNRTLGWSAQESGVAPPEIQGKRGVIVFIKLPTFSGQGHIDLWNDTSVVGHDYWDAKSTWFWSLD